MRLKSVVLSGLVCVSAFVGANSAYAAGYFGATSKTSYDGWACDPATPGYAGWIHLWRDDGKFLGALPSGIQRETAVQSICGDSGLHGFAGEISFPSEYLDNRTHTVRAYFIRDDGTNFELQNSVSVTFDGGPVAPPPPPQPVTQSGCSETGSPPSTGWVVTGHSKGGCPGSQLYFSWTYIADLPIGSEVAICYTTFSIPSNWRISSQPDSTANSKCYYSTGFGQSPDRYQIIKRIS